MVAVDKIFEQLSQDPEFQQQPQQAQDVFRPFIEAIPTILADLLDQPATLSNLMLAKVTFLRYCMANNFLTKFVAALPEGSFGWMSNESAAGMLEGTLNSAIEMAAALTENVAEQLAAAGITEDQVMRGPQIGLNDEAKQAYTNNELTIARLLEIQPMVIIKSS